MKLKVILIVLLCISVCDLIGQAPDGVYIIVKAKWTETRLIDDTPLPPRRENRLILSFYEMDMFGNYVPIILSNYDIWMFKEGTHYGSFCANMFDSCGNNYPGYSMTAPKVVSYHNSYGLNYNSCYPNMAEHYVVNGQELDCGFIQVSHWETDPDSFENKEFFTTPNICLPYYTIAPFLNFPGNLNFQWPIPPTPGNQFFSFWCADGIQQFIVKGVLMAADTSFDSEILPIRFANVRAVKVGDKIKLSWANLTESNIRYYELERSLDGNLFQQIGIIQPVLNDYGRADYTFIDSIAPINLRLFYRIKAVETNNEFLFSSIMRIQISDKKIPKLTLYPNPTNDRKVMLQLTNAAAGRYAIVLVSMSGKEKLMETIQHDGGSFTQSLSLDNMQAGMYIVLVKSNEATFSAKLIVRD